MSNRQMTPYFKVFFAVVAWGASFIATKVALQDISPATVVWLRFGIGVLILGLAAYWRGKLHLPGRDQLAYFALLGLIGIAFHQWLQSTALLTAQASTTAWIVATTPIFMALLGWAVLRERLTRLQVSGIALATLGVFLVVSEGDFKSFGVGQFGTPGDVLILISALNWAVFSTLSSRGLREHDAGLMMFFVMGFGWVFSSVLFFAGPGLADLYQLSPVGWAGILFLGVACSGLAYIFWYDGLQSIPASQVGAFLYLEPLVAVIAAAWILDEPVFAVSLIGGGVILAGVWLVNRNSAAKK